MKLRIEIETDNDAFRRGWRSEVRRILRTEIAKLPDPGDRIKLRDVNGNTVGFAEMVVE